MDGVGEPTLNVQSLVKRAKEIQSTWMTQRGRQREMAYISWKFPEQGWFKINVDGASANNPGKAGGGGVIRNDTGCWVKGFCINLGMASNVAAELLAILQGLKLAWDLGIRRVHLETDSLTGLELVMKEPRGSPHHNVIQEIRKQIKQQWECKVSHIWREGNQVADCLAKISLNMQPGLYVLDTPPQDIKSKLLFDEQGVTTPRLIAM